MTKPEKDLAEAERKRIDRLKTRHIDLILGQRLRDHRETMGLAREVVAAALDVSVTRIQNYEQGHRISASRLWQFCARYGIEVEALFAGLPHHVGPAPQLPEASARGLEEEQAPFTTPPTDLLLDAIGAAATDLTPVERSMALAALRGMAVRKFKRP